MEFEEQYSQLGVVFKLRRKGWQSLDCRRLRDLGSIAYYNVCMARRV